MNILSINSYSKPESILQSNGSNYLVHNFTNEKFAENIAKRHHELINELNINYSKIEIISIISGPGSFTGLRSGYAYIKSLLQFRDDVKLLEVDLFEVAKYIFVKERIVDGIFVVDAGNQNVFVELNNQIVVKKFDELELNNLNIYSDNEEFGIKLEITSLELYDYVLNNLDLARKITKTELYKLVPKYVVEPRIG